jgi:hypothetical protein
MRWHMPKKRTVRATKRAPRKRLALRKMTIRDLDPQKGVTIKGGSFKKAVGTSPL